MDAQIENVIAETRLKMGFWEHEDGPFRELAQRVLEIAAETCESRKGNCFSEFTRLGCDVCADTRYEEARYNAANRIDADWKVQR